MDQIQNTEKYMLKNNKHWKKKEEKKTETKVHLKSWHPEKEADLEPALSSFKQSNHAKAQHVDKSNPNLKLKAHFKFHTVCG